MPELREVFEMVTKQTEPDVDAWKEQERRQRRVSRNRKLGALAVAAAIGIVAVVVVIRAVDEGTGTQPGGQPTPTTAQPIPSISEGFLEPGRYVISTLNPDFDASHQITIDVPDGYEGLQGGWAAAKSGTDQTGVSTWVVANVYADACKWRGTADSQVSSVDGLVAALAGQRGLRVSTPTDATVDGFAGTYMERTVPAGINVADCDGAQFRVWLDSTRTGERYLGGPGQLDLLWILDVDGVPLAIDVSLDAGTSAQARAELVQIVESVRIDPR